MVQPEIINTLAKNRTEELGFDVWEHFVVPRFFDKLDFGVAKKPRLFIGGRGCGKTMLLRFLSHQSQFSPKRENFHQTTIHHIGLYWRVDTQFATMMSNREIPEDVWISAFDHFMALILSGEILKSLNSIATSRSGLLKAEDLAGLAFNRFTAFDSTLKGTYGEICSALESKLWQFESWVANVRTAPQPQFLPCQTFLKALIGDIQTAIPVLKTAGFFVYVDEFENLLNYQQRILNTRIKHSESPIIFNIAMKRHGFETSRTLGAESIQDIADFRSHDLEDYLLDHDFPVFAAEVLFLNLTLAGFTDLPATEKLLRDPEALEQRREDAYKTDVLNRARLIFPGFTNLELATHMFSSEAFKRKITERIQQALKKRKSSVSPEAFVKAAHPQESIVAIALLNRQRLPVEDVLHELNLLEKGQPNKFTGVTNWTHNNFVGCMLWLYEASQSDCPFYAGFDTFCSLAKGNLRHFLELCHKSLNQVRSIKSVDLLVVSPHSQAKAARQTSIAFLNEIPAFGRFGDRLHTFVLRLGSIFALAHRKPTQSEPEQSHFSIEGGVKPLTQDEIQFLKEASKWSVLNQEEETKRKNADKVTSFEYVLNPIYSPYFNITYRKKRKLPLTTDQLSILISGEIDRVEALLKQFSSEWKIEGTTEEPLFFGLNADS